jgi:hypothetical protein
MIFYTKSYDPYTTQHASLACSQLTTSIDMPHYTVHVYVVFHVWGDVVFDVVFDVGFSYCFSLP